MRKDNFFCKLHWLLLFALGSVFTSALPAQVILKRPGVTISLFSETEKPNSDRPFHVAVQFQHDSGHHSYWKTPGIVGLPTKITWHLPLDWKAIPLPWPAPVRTEMAGHPCHGYKGKVVFLTKITPSGKTIPLSELKVSLQWMACGDGCHPGFEDALLPLNAANSLPKKIKAALQELPRLAAAETIIEVSRSNKALTLQLQLQKDQKPHHFFSQSSQWDSTQDQVFEEIGGGRWRVSFLPYPTTLNAGGKPTQGVLRLQLGDAIRFP